MIRLRFHKLERLNILSTVKFMVMDLIFIIGFTNETPVRMLQTAIYDSEVQLETLSTEPLRENTFKHGAEKDSI